MVILKPSSCDQCGNHRCIHESQFVYLSSPPGLDLLDLDSHSCASSSMEFQSKIFRICKIFFHSHLLQVLQRRKLWRCSPVSSSGLTFDDIAFHPLEISMLNKLSTHFRNSVSIKFVGKCYFIHSREHKSSNSERATTTF